MQDYARRYLAANHPAIVVTVEGEENVDAAAKEAAEKAEASKAKKGGK